MSAEIPAAPAPVAERPPRPSATLVVVRAAPAGFEVLLSRRAERGDHNSGAWVFPGGLVDTGDRAAHASCVGLDDATASDAARRGRRRARLLHRRRARVLRGIGPALRVRAAGRAARRRRATSPNGWRHGGARCIAASACWATCAPSSASTLAVDRLIYLSHWITPVGRPKRFDTRFFLAVAPPRQTAAHDGTEMVEQLWLRPADALHESKALKLLTPTQKTLELLGRFAERRRARRMGGRRCARSS